MLNLDRLYSVFDEEETVYELADIVAELCGTRSAGVRWQNPAGGQPLDLMNYWPSNSVRRYFAEFTQSDPWLPIIELAGPGVIRGDALVPPDEVKRSQMYRELIRPLGDDTARLLAYVSAAREPRLVLAVHRADSDRAFDAADVTTLNTVSAHVERVLTLRARLVAVGGVPTPDGVSLLDATGNAVLLVDDRLCVSACTEAARAFLDRRDGLCLRDGHLCFVAQGLGASIGASVRSLVERTEPRRTSFHVPRMRTPQPLLLCVLPAGRRAMGRALIHLGDPTRLPGDAARLSLAELYGLSAAEVSVALALAQGDDIATIADQRGVTHETVRSQAKNIYAKTGVNRQGKLARLVAALPL